MKVIVDTSTFRFAHGKSPRGTGHWAFAPFEDIDVRDKRIIWISGTYSSAKRDAIKYAKDRNLDTLYLMS